MKSIFIHSCLVLVVISSTIIAAGKPPTSLDNKQNKQNIVNQVGHHKQHTITNNISIINPDIVVYINGMVCSFCAQGLMQAFESHNSIKEIKISIEKKSVELRLKPTNTLSDKEILTLVNDAGYDVKEIKRKEK